MKNRHIPLPERMRPTSFDAIVGQEHLIGEKGILRRLIKEGISTSFLLWGPPGSGKTTIAKTIAQTLHRPWYHFSGAMQGASEIKKTLQEIKNTPLLSASPLFFVDEIHRLNKAQQDLFLPATEDGTITLIAATTENPSFTINHALLSRMRVFSLQALSEEALRQIYQRYLQHPDSVRLELQQLKQVIQASHGDARFFLSLLECLEEVPPQELSTQDMETILLKLPLYDRDGDGHYQLISALHKAVRASDTDGSLFWLARMLHSGEDPLYLGRRLIRMALEDIGLADPHALSLCQHCVQAYERLGSPEGDLSLAMAVIYLSLAPKSNATYLAYKQAYQAAKEHAELHPPKHLINAPTNMMQHMGYGKGYQYDHDSKEGCYGQNCFPSEMDRIAFYKPVTRGFEREMEKRLAYFMRLRQKQQS